MALQARYKRYTLHFRFPAGTSRGVLHRRDVWLVRITDEAHPGLEGWGEAAPLQGLSPDARPDLEKILAVACERAGKEGFHPSELPARFPSVRFAMEAALRDLEQGGKHILYPSAFTRGEESIPINGLIWMGDPGWMKAQIKEKIEAGFHVLKMKVGALALEDELELLHLIRKEYSGRDLEIRLDANGAFPPGEAPEILERFAAYDIHSIEQPIAPGRHEAMARLCTSSPIPVALDEELIGPWHGREKEKLLDLLHPAYLVLKPTLLGGLSATEEWIRLARERGTGWWITSLLESNVGLNILAQWTYTLGNPLPQGLGTGMVFTNNFPSPLYLDGEHLHFDPSRIPLPELPWNE